MEISIRGKVAVLFSRGDYTYVVQFPSHTVLTKAQLLDAALTYLVASYLCVPAASIDSQLLNAGRNQFQHQLTLTDGFQLDLDFWKTLVFYHP